jgi:hypothetical protein
MVGFKDRKPKAKTEGRRPLRRQEQEDRFGSREPKTESRGPKAKQTVGKQDLKTEERKPKTEKTKTRI